ncbi:MAG: hypothetical protein ACTSU5_03830 [Promethearchaeota archaeon]
MNTFSELPWEPIHGLFVVLAVGLAFIVTYLALPKQIKLMHEKGWVGHDIHKKDRPAVAESGGLSLVVGIVVAMAILAVGFPSLTEEIFVLILTVVAAAAIGFWDDRKQLSSLRKIILVTIAGGPLFLANILGFIHVQSPLIPVLGYTQLTFIYPLAVPVIIAVTSNSANMLEGYNGEGAGTCIAVGASMVVGGLILGSVEAVIFSLVMCAGLGAFFLFNRYPARVFPGDVGTLAVGAMIGGIAVLGSIEVVMFCAFLQHVFNSFYVITSVRGLRESHNVDTKDIYVDDDDVIHASTDPNAPISLPRLILAGGPLDEPGLVKHFIVSSVITGIFGVVAALAMDITGGHFNLGLIVVVLVGSAGLYGVLYWRFPRIRSLSIIMILLLLGGLALLVFVDQAIVQMGNILNVLVSGSLGLGGLALWYVVQKKYFWHEIGKLESRI